MAMDPARAMTFVAEHSRGVLMTIRSDGRPQASNIMYGVVDDAREVRISVTDDRAKTRNLERDPRASLHVTSDDFWQWVVVGGQAELTPVAAEPGDATVTALRELFRAIRGEDHPDWDEYDRAMIDDRRRIVVLRPDHAYGQLAD